MFNAHPHSAGARFPAPRAAVDSGILDDASGAGYADVAGDRAVLPDGIEALVHRRASETADREGEPRG